MLLLKKRVLKVTQIVLKIYQIIPLLLILKIKEKNLEIFHQLLISLKRKIKIFNFIQIRLL